MRRMKQRKPFTFGMLLAAVVLLCHGAAMAGAPILNGVNPTLTPPVAIGDANPAGYTVSSFLNPIVTDGTLLDDFESNTNISKWGGTWFTYNDNPAGGLSVVTPFPFTAPTAGGYNNSAYCGKINVALHKNTLTYNPYVLLAINLKADLTVCNLTKATGFRYWYKGGKHIFKVETSDIDPGVAFQVAVPASAVWKQAVFTWDSLKQPGSAVAISATTKTLAKILSWVIQGADGTVDSLFIDNVEVTGFADRGIAVTGRDNANGAWQFSTNAGTTWTAFGALADNSATLLNAAGMVRFVPNATYTGPATFVFRAWNQTDNKANGATAQAAVPNGGITAYSSASATASVMVQSGTLTAPAITAQPQSQTVMAGQSVTFSVTATGTAPLSYQWYKDGTAISGATSSSYSISNVQTANAGTYTVTVSNGTLPNATSTGAVLTVSAAPVAPSITAQPQSQTVTAGQSVTFSVTATGTAPLSYQWYKGGTAISGATSSSYSISNVQTANAGTYTVTVSNGTLPNATSTGAVLTVGAAAVAPSITAQPQSQTVTAGQSVTFNVTAAGTAPLSYQWYKDGTAISGATSSSYSISNVQTANAGTYTVTVSNGTLPNVTSTGAVLTVVAAIVAPSNATVTITPQSVVAGAPSVSIQVNVAIGTPPYTYLWRKDGIVMAPAKTTQTLTIAPVALTDAGSYTVMVKNAKDSTLSSAGVLTVTPPVKASFTVSDSIIKAPDTIFFTDKSTGGTKRIWIFGDNTTDTTNIQNPWHIYTTPATYVAKLILMNGAVRVDSMSISIKVYKDNPISITGKYSSPGKAEITYTTSAIPTSFPPPYADSVRLMYKSGNSIPLTATGTTLGRGYTVTAITGTQPYTDIVPVTLAGADDRCGFMTQVHWFNGSSWYWSDFNSSNGTVVVMKDTFPPVNNARVAGNYIYNTDSVVFSAYNMISGVDPATVDSFAIWFGTDTSQSTPNFSDPTQTRWFNLQAEMPTITATNGRDSVIIRNPLFNTGVQKKLYCALVLKGKNDKLSITVIKAAYLAGVTRQANPIILHASAPSASKVILSWNPIGGVSAIRIWYRANAAVPVNTASFTSPPFDSITLPSVTQTQDTISGLIGLTHYFFGAQVYQGSQWSNVIDSSSADATTPIGHEKLPGGNTVKITSLVFDTITNEIKVSWSVDYPYVDPLEIGISYSMVAFPTIDTSASHQIVPVTASSGSAVIKLQETLKFSSLTDTSHYYVALWERSVDGTMTDPTTNSEAMVTISYYTWQNVTYFTTVPSDINNVFNGNILLVTEGVTDPSFTNGKIILYQPAPASLAGFIPVGVPFYFDPSKIEQSRPFTIKIRCGTLPAPHTLNQVKIYRWENGSWFVDRSTAFDSTGYVWITTKWQDLYPFMALIDTQDVSLKISAHSDTVIARTDILDTLYISDNVGNVTWSYSYAKGGDPYSLGVIKQDTLSSTSDTQSILITGSCVSPDNGLRAIVTVSDGVHNDTINVSRQVARVDSGDFEYVFTDAMKWVPLRVTAALSNTDVKTIFRYASGGQEFVYDPKQVRLFMWQQQKWVEYSDNVKSLFTPLPGMLLWIKTRESRLVNFGGGITPSLRQPYPISLTSGDFTDFALPFKFPIKVGDIIDQSGPGAENLEFYSWVRDPVSNRFVPQPLYLAGTGQGSKSSPVGCADLTGYSVFCPAGATTPTTLSIPPIPEPTSKYNSLTKRASFNGWTVSVNASLSDGTRLCPVYCGYSAGQGAAPTFFPVPPSFLEAYAGVVDNTVNKIYGHAMVHALAGGGCSYQIAFVNTSSGPQTLAYHLENAASLPKGLVAKVYNEATGAYENPSASVSLAAGETQHRWLLVGSEAYLSKSAAFIKNGKLLFAGTYPNPSGAFVHIRYSVPQTGVSGVKFSIYDMRGRLVWQKTTAEHGSQGIREIIWDGTSLNKRPVVAGIYVIRMEALDAKQKSAGIFEKKMTYMP